jgi:hypothetical protein
MKEQGYAKRTGMGFFFARYYGLLENVFLLQPEIRE